MLQHEWRQHERRRKDSTMTRRSWAGPWWYQLPFASLPVDLRSGFKSGPGEEIILPVVYVEETQPWCPRTLGATGYL